MDNRVGIDCGSGRGERAGKERATGENWDHSNKTAIKK